MGTLVVKGLKRGEKGYKEARKGSIKQYKSGEGGHKRSQKSPKESKKDEKRRINSVCFVVV